jgi:hypothetical protein
MIIFKREQSQEDALFNLSTKILKNYQIVVDD